MACRYTKNLSKLTKNLVKQILNTFGWSLVKKSNIPRIVKEDIQIDYIKSIMDSSGVLHIGAHRGFESHIYYWFGKDVIWIDAIKEKRVLNDEGILIIHRHKNDNIKISSKLTILDERSYGISKIIIAS